MKMGMDSLERTEYLKNWYRSEILSG